MIAADPEPGRRRPSIEERAARRDRIEHASGDRWTTLLNSLRAGREIKPAVYRRDRLEWHPIARKLVLLILAGVVLYAAASVGYRLWRAQQVDAWNGPDATVSSGQQLASCAAVGARPYDPVYPVWVRYNGLVFVATGFGRPFPTDPTGEYEVTPYHLGNLDLWTVVKPSNGRPGGEVILRFRADEAGLLFAAAPDCS